MKSSFTLPSRELRQHTIATLVLLTTLGCVIPRANASRIMPTKYAGVIQSIDYGFKTIIFQRGSDGKDFRLNWYWDTTFVADGKRVRAEALKVGLPVKVEYHVPLFGKQYISRIEWSTSDVPAAGAARPKS